MPLPAPRWRRLAGGFRFARLQHVVPVHLEVVAPAEPAEVPGDDILDPSQVLLVGGLGAQNQRTRRGLRDALAPWVESDGAVGVGPFGIDGGRQLAGRPRITGEVTARPVT